MQQVGSGNITPDFFSLMPPVSSSTAIACYSSSVAHKKIPEGFLHTYLGATHKAACWCSRRHALLLPVITCGLWLQLALSQPDLSILCTCDWLTTDWSLQCVTLPLAPRRKGWREGVCVRERQIEQYTPLSSRAPSPHPPLCPLTPPRCECLCMCVGHSPALGAWGFFFCLCVCVCGAGGGHPGCHTAMSGSQEYVFILWQPPTLSTGVPMARSQKVADAIARRGWGHPGMAPLLPPLLGLILKKSRPGRAGTRREPNTFTGVS